MAFVDDVIAQMRTTIASPRTGTSYLRLANGAGLYNSYGGGASQAKITSFQSIVGSLAGHQQYFVENYSSNCQFLTINVLDGHTATNTAVDVRRGFSCVLRPDGVWEYSYKDAAFWGKRLYNGVLSYDTPGTQTQLSGGILRVQPGAAIALPNETATQKAEAGYEVWPSNWDNAGKVAGMLGNSNRALFSQAKAFFLGVQLRLSLWNPSGPDDRSSAIVVAQTGFDGYVVPYTGYRYIYDNGTKTNETFVAYPYGAFDGSFGPWLRIASNDWMWLYCLTVKDITSVAAALPPPWAEGWSQPWPWNATPTYSISEATLRSNPPPAPDSTVVVSDQITDSDPRWVWNIDSRKTFAETGAAYQVTRQITDFQPTAWPTGVPTDDGLNQPFTQVTNPDGSPETVFKQQIRKDRAYGGKHSGWSGYANTYRSEFTNGSEWGLEWDKPYWMAFALWLDPDMTAEEPMVVLMDLHVPWQVTSTATKNSPIAIHAGGALDLSVLYCDHLATNSNERVTGAIWSDPNPAKGVWHHFALQLRMGPSSNSYVKAWRKVGTGPIVQIMDYSGLVGYVITETDRKYYYPIQGPYSWTYPWPTSGSATRTVYSKGFRLLRDELGSPVLDVTKVMNLVVYGANTEMPTEPGEPPPPPPDTSGRVSLPTLGSWFIADIESKAAWEAKSPESSGTVIVRRPRRAQIFT